MLLEREARRSHLDLTTPCDQRGGHSKEFRGLLAHYLGTTIPRGKVLLCHACNVADCSNPKHLYWGTHKDNHIDARECGAYKTFHERLLDKYGKEGTKEVKRQSKLGKPGGSPYSEEQISQYREIVVKHVGKRGWIQRVADELNISHTQVRRFVNKHAKDLEYGSVV